MSFQVETHFVNAYRANLTFLVQQRGSRLRPHVRVESQRAEYEFYDRIGPTEVLEIVGRHQDTPLVSTPHDRRRVGLRDFDWADLIDRQDKLRLLADPTSAYAQNAMMAFGRKMDDLIIEAAFDLAYTGKTGNHIVRFPDRNIIPVNAIPASSPDGDPTGMTIGKMLIAKEILDAYENDPDAERNMCMSARQITNLLLTTEVTNTLYNEVRALVEGKVNTFLGFNIIRSERLQYDVVDEAEPRLVERKCIAWIKDKLLLATAQEPMVDVGPRRDKRNSIQVYASMGMSATRMEEEGVVQIVCSEDLKAREPSGP